MVSNLLERGHEVPEDLRRNLWDLSTPYYHGWLRLHASRPYAAGPNGMFPQGLPYTEVVAYARDHGLAETLHDLDEFLDLMAALDDTYLDWWRKQNE